MRATSYIKYKSFLDITILNLNFTIYCYQMDNQWRVEKGIEISQSQ